MIPHSTPHQNEVGLALSQAIARLSEEPKKSTREYSPKLLSFGGFEDQVAPRNFCLLRCCEATGVWPGQAEIDSQNYLSGHLVLGLVARGLN